MVQFRIGFPERQRLRANSAQNEEADYLWHRIIPLAAPGMAACQAFDTKPGAFNHAMSVHCVMGIMGATGQIPAGSWQQRGKAGLICSNKKENRQLHCSDASPPPVESRLPILELRWDRFPLLRVRFASEGSTQHRLSPGNWHARCPCVQSGPRPIRPPLAFGAQIPAAFV